MPPKTGYQRFYWPLQTAGWLLYGAIGISSSALSPSGISASYIILGLIGTGILFLSTHTLRLRAKRTGWHRLGFGKLLQRIFAATLLIAIVSQCLLSVLMFWPLRIINEHNPYSFLALGFYILQTQIFLTLWSLLYFSFHAFRNYRSEEIEKWRLQAAVKDAELIALKAQINPHFIFNCLNNIRALVLEDPAKARDAITQLSDLLRSSIQFNKAEKISLKSELAMVRDYLALEAIHMEDRLRYTIHSDPAAESFEIPPMSIQLLAENAIKHSLAKLPQGGSIDIDIQKSPTALAIEVRNTGQLNGETSAPSPDSTGIGLQNLRERLRLLHGPTATLSLKNHDTTQVSARIEIPLREEPRIHANNRE